MTLLAVVLSLAAVPKLSKTLLRMMRSCCVPSKSQLIALAPDHVTPAAKFRSSKRGLIEDDREWCAGFSRKEILGVFKGIGGGFCVFQNGLCPLILSLWEYYLYYLYYLYIIYLSSHSRAQNCPPSPLKIQGMEE